MDKDVRVSFGSLKFYNFGRIIIYVNKCSVFDIVFYGRIVRKVGFIILFDLYVNFFFMV